MRFELAERLRTDFGGDGVLPRQRVDVGCRVLVQADDQPRRAGGELDAGALRDSFREPLSALPADQVRERTRRLRQRVRVLRYREALADAAAGGNALAQRPLFEHPAE